MIISRRSFLIGSSSAIAVAVTAQSTLAKVIGGIDDVVKTTIPSRHRVIYDLIWSSNASVDDLVEFTLARDDAILMQLAINSRACYRWVAAPGSEFVFPSHIAFDLIVANKGNGYERKPVHPTTRLQLLCEDENRRKWSEVYRWDNGKATICSREPLVLTA